MASELDNKGHEDRRALIDWKTPRGSKNWSLYGIEEKES